MLLPITIALFSACLTIFINYCIGKPGGSDFSPHEIFSGYTKWICIKRLKKIGLWDEYMYQYSEGIDRMKSYTEILNFENDFKIILYQAASPFFTWERAAGMCSVCSGVWVSLITGICFTQNILNLIVIVITCHVIIRILNKII